MRIEHLKIHPADVRIGDKIMCTGGCIREVNVIHYYDADTFRFMFTDNHWIEYKTNKKVTIRVRIEE